MLHIISNPNAIAACAKHLLDDDAIMLIGDGVYGLAEPSLDTQIPIYALKVDLAARGVSAASNVTSTNMARFVSLVVQHASSVTWT